MFLRIGNQIISQEQVVGVEYLKGNPGPNQPHYCKVIVRTTDGKEINAYDERAEAIWTVFLNMALDIAPELN